MTQNATTARRVTDSILVLTAPDRYDVVLTNTEATELLHQLAEQLGRKVAPVAAELPPLDGFGPPTALTHAEILAGMA